jgi:hypothetical protein
MAAEKFSMSVPLVGNPLDLYSVRLQVGNQYFAAMLDSGSSNLILPGKDCFGCGPVLAAYTPSVNARDLHIYDFLQYGPPDDPFYHTGAYGDFFLDDVVIDGVDPVSLVVMSVTASGLQGPKSTVNKGQPMQGILGVGPESLGFLNQHGIGRLGNDSYLNALGKLDMASILAVQLCTSNGYMWLGHSNPEHFEADPVYAPVAYPQMLPYGVLVNISVGSQDNLTVNNTLTIVDTGTNLLLLTREGYVKFMSIIDPKGDMFGSDDCLLERSLHPADAKWHLPDMTISFIENFTDMTSSKHFKLPAAESYMVPSVQADGTTLWCHRVSWSNQIFNGSPFIIMGAPLMRHFVILFDNHSKEGPRVGFTPQSNGTCPHNPSPPSPPPQGHPHPTVHWWEVVLWTISALAVLAVVLTLLEHYYRGRVGWLSAVLSWRNRGFTAPRDPLQDALASSLT